MGLHLLTKGCNPFFYSWKVLPLDWNPRSELGSGNRCNKNITLYLRAEIIQFTSQSNSRLRMHCIFNSNDGETTVRCYRPVLFVGAYQYVERFRVNWYGSS